MATSPIPSPQKAHTHGPSASMSSLAGYETERSSSKRGRTRSHMLDNMDSDTASELSVTSTSPLRSRTQPLRSPAASEENDGVEWLSVMASQQHASREAGETPGRLVPPLAFAIVSPGVFRSGHPSHRNFHFLEGLHLKSIMYLCSDRPRPHTDHWAQERRLKVFHYPIDSAKDPSTPVTAPALYAAALADVLDRRNHPMLIHCNKGKHRVGTLCAILRRIQGWTLESVGAEWIKFIEEGAPPGTSGLWSPPVHSASEMNDSSPTKNGNGKPDKRKEAPTRDGVKRGKDGRIKDKHVVSKTREREWEYIRSFPLEVVTIREPAFRPSWLPQECIVTEA